MRASKAAGSGPERTIWVRREPTPGESALAGAVALAAGAVLGGAVLYLARMFVARDELILDAVPEREGSSG